jgi:hypothetical protein
VTDLADLAARLAELVLIPRDAHINHATAATMVMNTLSNKEACDSLMRKR